MDKDTRVLLAEAERQGFTVTISKRGHPQVYLNDKWVTTLSGTAGDWRSMKNALAAIKRAGFIWPPRRR